MGSILRLAARQAAVLRKCVATLMVCLLVGACAAPPPHVSAADAPMPDPFEGLNRHIFAMNDAVDTVLIRPAAYIYREATPSPIKDILSNFLGHLTLPLVIIHDLFQGKPEQAQVAFTRLFINTTVGIGGLFDIATPAGYPIHEEDMGQTLAVHGVVSGPYFVLPLLGPSSFRDAFGTAVDAFADPVSIATYGSSSGSSLRLGRAGAEGLVRREQLIEPLDAMRQSLDYYAAVRSAYRQQRASQIRDGAPKPSTGTDDPFASFDNENAAPVAQ